MNGIDSRTLALRHAVTQKTAVEWIKRAPGAWFDGFKWWAPASAFEDFVPPPRSDRPPVAPEGWLTVREVAPRLGYSRRHINHLIGQGRIPAQKIREDSRAPFHIVPEVWVRIQERKKLEKAA